MRTKTKFQGFTITWSVDGFYWEGGGYHDTIEACQAEIAEHNEDMRSDENIYGLASMQQSIEEDRRR